jgi:hypothetical protein
MYTVWLNAGEQTLTYCRTLPVGLRDICTHHSSGHWRVKSRGTYVFCESYGKLVFLEWYGTWVAVSAPLVLPLHDSDIPMNNPITFCNT